MKTKITIADLDRWGACDRDDGQRYSNANLKKLMKGKSSIDIIDVLYLRILPEDILWVILREELLPKKILQELANKFARRAVKRHCLKCGIAEVEQLAKEYIKSGNVRAADAARAAKAARVAAVADAARARAAARAARAAAWDDAWVAATAAAWAAADAWDVAWVARVAARAERKWQVIQVRKILKEKENENKNNNS